MNVDLNRKGIQIAPGAILAPVPSEIRASFYGMSLTKEEVSAYEQQGLAAVHKQYLRR